MVIPNERPNMMIATFFDTLTWESGLSGASPPGFWSVLPSSSPSGERRCSFLWATQVRKVAATIAPFCLSKLGHKLDHYRQLEEASRAYIHVLQNVMKFHLETPKSLMTMIKTPTTWAPCANAAVAKSHWRP
jgi:hypothetical protein